jgi:hypothetical protein
MTTEPEHPLSDVDPIPQNDVGQAALQIVELIEHPPQKGFTGGQLMAFAGRGFEIQDHGGVSDHLDRTGVALPPTGPVDRRSPDLPATGQLQFPLSLLAEEPVRLVDEGAELQTIHLGQHSPQRGIGGHHGSARPKPLLGALVSSEEVNLVEALLAHGQGAYHQKEDAGDGDLRSLAGLEEMLGLETQVELVGAETGEV